MKKIDKVTIVKILGLALTVGGTIATAWAGDKDTSKTLEKLVDERFQEKLEK